MLTAHEISFSYPEGPQVLRGISLELRSGEMLTITGPNGCGKTTLALILAGIIPPDSGELRFKDVAVFSDDGQALIRRELSLLFQDPEDGILTTSVEREIAFGPENHGIPTDHIRAIVDDLASKFGLTPVLRNSTEELSGGELERCALAAAIATQPSVIILDEPDSFLDYDGKHRFWEEIEKLKSAGTAIVHITQSETAIMRAEKVLELAPVIERRRIRLVRNPVSIRERVIEMRNVSFSYDKKPVIENVDFTIIAGESVAIFGESGSGKTTLARIAAGLYKPDSGTVESTGRVGISFQFPARQLFAETVRDDVAFGPKSIGLDGPKTLAESALKAIGVERDLFDRSPFELSDGEQRRVGIAGILAIDPVCVFFDEPTATLDSRGRARFVEIVVRLNSEGKGVALITHDIEIAARCCSRAIVLKNGGVIFDGDIDILMTDRELRNSLGLGTDSDIYGGALCAHSG